MSLTIYSQRGLQVLFSRVCRAQYSQARSFGSGLTDCAVAARRRVHPRASTAAVLCPSPLRVDGRVRRAHSAPHTPGRVPGPQGRARGATPARRTRSVYVSGHRRRHWRAATHTTQPAERTRQRPRGGGAGPAGVAYARHPSPEGAGTLQWRTRRRGGPSARPAKWTRFSGRGTDTRRAQRRRRACARHAAPAAELTGRRRQALRRDVHHDVRLRPGQTCSGDTAAKHQSYIEREDARIASFGMPSETLPDREPVWRGVDKAPSLEASVGERRVRSGSGHQPTSIGSLRAGQ